MIVILLTIVKTRNSKYATAPIKDKANSVIGKLKRNQDTRTLSGIKAGLLNGKIRQSSKGGREHRG